MAGYQVDINSLLNNYKPQGDNSAQPQQQGLSPIQQATQGQQPQQPGMSLGGFVQNAGADTGALLKGILNLPGLLLGGATNPSSIPDIGSNVVKGITGEYGNLLSNPIQHGYDKPISTILDVLPFLKPLQALMGIGKAGKVGVAAEGAGAASKGAEIGSPASKLGAVTTAPTLTDFAPTSTGMNPTSSLLNDTLQGGAKPAEVAQAVKLPTPPTAPPELTQAHQAIVNTAKTLVPDSASLIKRNALSANPVSGVQAALENNVYSSPTQAGQMANINKAMESYVGNIKRSLTSSGAATDTNTLWKNAQADLKSSGVPQATISKVHDIVYGGQSNQALSGIDAWNRIHAVDKGGSIYTGVAATTPIQNALRIAAKSMRNDLATLSPETQPYLSRYGALADHLGGFPERPTGIQIPSIGNIPQAVGNTGKNVSMMGLQKAFNAVKFPEAPVAGGGVPPVTPGAGIGAGATEKAGLLQRVLNPVTKDNLGAAGGAVGKGVRGLPGLLKTLSTSQVNQLLRNYPTDQGGIIPTAGSQDQSQTAMNDNPGSTINPADALGQAPTNKYPIESYMADVTRDPKNQAYYKQIYDAHQQQDQQYQKSVQDFQKSDQYKQAQNGIKAKSQIQAIIDQFQSVPKSQIGILGGAIEKVPLLGQVVAPAATEYESQRAAISPILKDLSGAGLGSGVRVTQAEINNWVKELPSVHKTAEQNRIDIQRLNTRLKAALGVGLDQQYLTQ